MTMQYRRETSKLRLVQGVLEGLQSLS